MRFSISLSDNGDLVDARGNGTNNAELCESRRPSSSFELIQPTRGKIKVRIRNQRGKMEEI
jgi:hypothetical protein